MTATKISVEIPQWLGDNYPAARHTECYVINGGPYHGCFVHLAPMMFTVALMVSEDEYSWKTRWCYESYHEAAKALVEWSGEGDPPGPWIKQKPEERPGPGSRL